MSRAPTLESGESAAPPGLSIVIPSWNTKTLTCGCLRSLVEADHGLALEVIVVDNGSHDGSPDMVAREFPDVVLIRNERNEYYSKACNQGAAVARGKFLCLLNSDTAAPAGSLRLMVDYLQDHPEYGAAAPRLDNPDGSLQPICRRFPTLMEVLVNQFDPPWGLARRYQDRMAMKDFDHLSSMDVEQPPGTCILMRREEFSRLGGFDESLPLFYSDVDLCLRMWRAGRRIRFLPEARIFHVGSASVVRHPLWRAEFMRDQVRYFRKHRGRLAAAFAKSVIVASALNTGLRTTLGRRRLREKRELLQQIARATRIAVRG